MKEVYVCLHELFFVLCDDVAHVIVEICCVATTFIWCNTIICYCVGEVLIHFHLDGFVAFDDGRP